MDSAGGDVQGIVAPVSLGVDELARSLDHLVKLVDDGGLDVLDDAGLVEFTQQLETLRRRLPLIDHRVVEAVTARDLASTMCRGSVRQLLTSTLRISKAEANRRIRAADAVGSRWSMTGESLDPVRPALAAAQRDGEVSAEHVDIIARALGSVDRRGFDPADIDAGEQLLVGHARTFGPEDLRQLATRVVDGIDPDGSLPQTELNEDRRDLELTSHHDGSWGLNGRLTGAAGAKLRALLDPLAKLRVDAGAVADSRRRGQRMHDALEDLCDRLLRDGDVPGPGGGTPATVIITIDLDDLLNRTGHGRTADGTLLPAAQVLELARDAELIPACLTSTGKLVDLGRTRRLASPAQTLALFLRDSGCSFPGCDRNPAWCERHHIIAWIDGGETNLDNLTLLCRYHHHNFAARGWTCRINKDGVPTWSPPRWVDRSQTPLINNRIRESLAARRNKHRTHVQT